MSRKVVFLMPVLLGAMFGAMLAIQPDARAQFPVEEKAVTASTCCWPPVPANIVNVDSDQNFPIVVPDGGISPASLYTVPANKKLVITDFELMIAPSIMGVYPFAQNTPIQIVEDLGGVITVKRGAVFGGNHNGAFPGPNTGIPSNLVSPNGAHGYHSSGVGLVFAPGSNVRLAIRDPNSIDSSLGAVVVVSFTFTGYLK